MENLIPFHKNEQGQILVSARDLHDFLEIGKDFSTWFKDMANYGFENGKDFSPISGESHGGRPRTDYVMTSDMAKELSMIQRTDKGKQARQYFIEMEKKAIGQKQLSPIEQLRLATKGVVELDDRVTTLEDTMRVSGPQEKSLQDAAKLRVFKVLGGKNSNAYQKVGSKIFRQCWHDFKKYFQLPRYGELPRVKFGDAIKFLGAWLPDTETRLEIAHYNAQGDLFEEG